MCATASSRRLTFTAAAALAALVTGCGDDSGATAGYEATDAGLEAAAADMMDAFLHRPSATYDFLSAACKEAVSESEWGMNMMVVTGMIESFMDLRTADLQVGDVTVRNVDGDSGEAAVVVLDKDGNPLEGFLGDGEDAYTAFVYEDGSWRTTDCETMGDGTDVTDGTGGPETTFGGELTPADAATEAAARMASLDGELGSAYDLGNLRITVSAIEAAHPANMQDMGVDAAVSVTARVENRSAEDDFVPTLQLVCADGNEGFWLDSTLEPMAAVPSTSFAEGDVTISLPQDCTDPVVRATSMMGEDTIDWPVPTAALAG